MTDQAVHEIGQHVEVVEDVDGDAVVRNTNTGAEIKLGDFLDIVGSNGLQIDGQTVIDDQRAGDFTSLTTVDARTRRPAVGHSIDDSIAGPVLGANSRSYSNQYQQALNSAPVQRNKPIIVIRGDRMDDALEDVHAFKERRLPWSLSLTPPNLPGGSAEFDSHHDLIREVASYGAEISLYTGSGSNLRDDVDDYDDLIDILWKGKQGIEDQGFNCNTMGPRGGNGFEPLEKGFDTARNRAIESMFVASGLALINTRSHLAPVGNHVGRGENLIMDSNDPTQSEVDSAKEKIDKMIQSGGPAIARHFFHPNSLTNNNKWGIFEDFLDKLEEERNDGNIQVVTPPMYANASHNPSEYNLVVESSPQFEDASDSMWSNFGSYPNVGDWGGDPYWIVGQDGDGIGGVAGLRARGFDAWMYFGTLMVELDAKTPTGETNTLTVDIQSFEYVDGDSLDTWELARYEPDIATDEFERQYFSFGFPRAGDGGEINIWANNEDVHVKNVKIYPI